MKGFQVFYHYYNIGLILMRIWVEIQLFKDSRAIANHICYLLSVNLITKMSSQYFGQLIGQAHLIMVIVIQRYVKNSMDIRQQKYRNTQLMSQAGNSKLASPKQCFSQGGMLMYEQVLSKNFDIIQNLLKRFHDVYSKQQEFEQIIVSFRERIQFFQTKLQSFTQNSKDVYKNFEKKMNSLKNLVKNKQFHNSIEEKRVTVQQSHQFRNSSLLISEQAKKQIQKQMFVKIMDINAELRDRLNKNQYDIQETNQKINSVNDNLRSYLNVLDSNLQGTKEKYADRKQFNDLKSRVEKSLTSDSNFVTSKIDSTLFEKINGLKNVTIDQVNQKIKNVHVRIAQIEQKAANEAKKLSQVDKQIKADLLKVVQESKQVFVTKEQMRKNIGFLDRKMSRIKAQKGNGFCQANDKQIDISLAFKQGRFSSCYHKSLKKDPHKLKSYKSNLFLSRYLNPDNQNKENEIQRNQLTCVLDHRRLIQSSKPKYS